MLPTTPTARLLLIEDEQDMARYLSKGLEEAGYAVTHSDQADQPQYRRTDYLVQVMAMPRLS